ncbi:TPA: 4-hydroxy-2-oxovalerate aldolase [Streptococcus mutans]|uniref:4-hydroxy-2-oxovalerate aldolase n=1 Tax=Streptococcus mutans TaxID=1309 RepID=UPI00066A6B55|nr:4-hydroxy-2-oxovalerate aldolase [Streptococcus mutans]MCY7115586.1 4-hydroxy-2-oxovalerate aldolase [Streptococcus mutans]
MFKLMDVTLREGYYVSNNSLSNEFSKVIIEKLHNSEINNIEIGYLGDDTNSSGTEKCDFEYLDFLTDGKIEGWERCFSIMIQPEKFYEDNIDVLNDLRIGMVRLTVTKTNIQKVTKIIERLKNYNVAISVNVIRGSRLNDCELKEILNTLTWTTADIIYIADSNGAMLPQDVKHSFNIAKEIVNKGNSQKLGFHAHNHLGMALPNALTAIESGCDYIDASLLGYGKSSGNLPLEVFLALLKRQYLFCPWDIQELLSLSKSFYEEIKKSDFYKSKTEGAYIGMNNLNLDEVNKIYIEENITSLIDRRGEKIEEN